MFRYLLIKRPTIAPTLRCNIESAIAMVVGEFYLIRLLFFHGRANTISVLNANRYQP